MSRAGSITKDASGRWMFAVDLSPAGAVKRKQVRRRGFKTKAAAQAALDEEKQKIREGGYVAPSRQTLGGYLATWLEALPASGRRENTLRGYAQRLAYVRAHELASVRLQDVTPLDLDRMYSDLLARGGKGGSKLSPQTVRLTATALGTALADAVRTDQLARNPTSKARPPVASAAVRHGLEVWTPRQLGLFLGSVADTTHATLWRVYGMTGLRRGEAIGLRWLDVDLDAGALVVAQAVTVAGGKAVVGPPKTTRSRRRIDLDEASVTALRAHRKAQNERRLLLGAGWHDMDLVFGNVTGQPYRPAHITAAFRRAAEASGLPRIRLHDLRHSHAVHLLVAGANPRMVSERLGHSSVAFTLDRYGHVLDGQQATVAAAVADLVDGPALRAV